MEPRPPRTYLGQPLVQADLRHPHPTPMLTQPKLCLSPKSPEHVNLVKLANTMHSSRVNTAYGLLLIYYFINEGYCKRQFNDNRGTLHMRLSDYFDPQKFAHGRFLLTRCSLNPHNLEIDGSKIQYFKFARLVYRSIFLFLIKKIIYIYKELY